MVCIKNKPFEKKKKKKRFQIKGISFKSFHSIATVGRGCRRCRPTLSHCSRFISKWVCYSRNVTLSRDKFTNTRSTISSLSVPKCCQANEWPTTCKSHSVYTHIHSVPKRVCTRLHSSVHSASVIMSFIVQNG